MDSLTTNTRGRGIDRWHCRWSWKFHRACFLDWGFAPSWDAANARWMERKRTKGPGIISESEGQARCCGCLRASRQACMGSAVRMHRRGTAAGGGPRWKLLRPSSEPVAGRAGRVSPSPIIRGRKRTAAGTGTGPRTQQRSWTTTTIDDRIRSWCGWLLTGCMAAVSSSSSSKTWPRTDLTGRVLAASIPRRGRLASCMHAPAGRQPGREAHCGCGCGLS
jgi:hypothetical protein